MAVVRKKRVRWDADPNTPDIIAHKVYVAKEADVLDYASPNVQVTMPQTEIILPDAYPPGTFDEDVNYQVGISAVDDVGNESNIVIVTAPFDFIAPGAPSNIVVENV